MEEVKKSFGSARGIQLKQNFGEDEARRMIEIVRFKDGVGYKVAGDPEWVEKEFDRIHAKYKDCPGFGAERGRR